MKARFAFFYSLVLALVSDRPAAPAEQPAAVLLWRVSPSGETPPELAESVEQQLRAGLPIFLPGGLFSVEKMDQLLWQEGSERFLNCGRSVSCLAELGLAAGVAMVMNVSVRQEKERLVSELLLVATAKAESWRFRVVHGPRLDEAALDKFARAASSPERFRGRIELSCPVSGADVLLDGKVVGTTPSNRLLETSAGLHLLEVKKDHHLPFVRELEVPLDGTCTAVALLPEQPRPEQPRPFYRRWFFWTLAAVGTAGISAGGALYYDLGILRDNAEQLKTAGLASATWWQQRADARAVQTYAAFAVGGAGLLAAAVMAVIDLAGGGEEASTAPTSSMSSTIPLRLFSW